MSILPAYCPKCHSIFAFRGVKFNEGATLEINNIGTNCPVCGYTNARVNDGVYRATKDAIGVLSGSNSTKVMMEALKAVAERLAAGKITRDEAIQEADKLSPKYATLIDIFSQLGLPGLTLLATVIAIYISIATMESSSEDTQKIVDAITE